MFATLVLYASAPRLFKQAQKGLFAGGMKQYGNNVPKSKHKTRRTWMPNIQPKRLFSEALGETIKVKVTARALKTIDKYGGIDGYLLGMKDTKLGDEGMRLRMLVKLAKEPSSSASAPSMTS
jgi:large subunit ribosomal protein L28